MTQQVINIGSAPNDGTGDPAQTAFDKANDNFTELYAKGTAEGIWNFDATSMDTTTTPVSGRFKTNSGNYRTATQIAIHATTIQGIDRANTLRTLLVGDLIQCQDRSNAAAWCRYSVLALPVDHTTWFAINVALQADGGVASGNNQEIIFVFTASGNAVTALDSASKTTINPRRVHSFLTASNGNLTLTKTTNEANFRSAVSIGDGRSGLKYLEVQSVASAVSSMIGAGYAFPPYEVGSNFPGNNVNSMGFQSGLWFQSGGGTGGFPTWVAGNWLGVCFDTDEGGAGIRNITQGGNWNNVVGGNPGLPAPAAGMLYTFACLQQSKLAVIACLLTFNAGWNLNFDGPFIGPVPTGAKPWGSGGI